MVGKRVWIVGVAVALVCAGAAVTAWALDKPPVRHISAPKATMANSVSMASIVPGDELQLVSTNDPAEISHVSLDAVDRYRVINKQTFYLEPHKKDPMVWIELRRSTTTYAFMDAIRPHIIGMIELQKGNPIEVEPALYNYTFRVVGGTGTVDMANIVQLGALCGARISAVGLSQAPPPKQGE